MFFAARNNLNPSALARSSILGSYSPPNSRDQKPRARPCIIATGSRGLRSRYSPTFGEEEFCELRGYGVLRSSAIIQSQGVGKGSFATPDFWTLHLSVYF
jgi:hypothetical protein